MSYKKLDEIKEIPKTEMFQWPQHSQPRATPENLLSILYELVFYILLINEIFVCLKYMKTSQVTPHHFFSVYN